MDKELNEIGIFEAFGNERIAKICFKYGVLTIGNLAKVSLGELKTWQMSMKSYVLILEFMVKNGMFNTTEQQEKEEEQARQEREKWEQREFETAKDLLLFYYEQRYNGRETPYQDDISWASDNAKNLIRKLKAQKQ